MASDKPAQGYLKATQIKKDLLALKKYVALQPSMEKKKKKSLLEAGDDSKQKAKLIAEVVFKNIPSNQKTYIHNVVLPHHWRLELEPENYNVAVFVPHKKPTTEAQKIQFDKDRDLDIEHTHEHYQKLFTEKLDEQTRARISRIITSKELATEFSTFQKIDKLSKTYDLFLGDKKLMCNKMNALPRRLGRRFWVREKKVPLIVKLNAPDLADRFKKAMSTEPFYVVGISSTEKLQLGHFGQKIDELVANVKAFLEKLYQLYGDQVRFIRLRSNSGLAFPIYADLSCECPKEVKILKKKIKAKPVVGEFDLLPGAAKVKVHPDGQVRVLRSQAKPKRKSLDSPAEKPLSKRVKK